MEPFEFQERLKALDTSKLIDVVKNYRQYGYDENVRNYALTLLEEQGISKSDLVFTGNLENKTYDLANDLLLAFKRNSKLAFLFYIAFVGLNLFAGWSDPGTGLSNLLLISGIYLSIVLYVYFLLKSFLNQSSFYKATGEEFGSEGTLVYLFLGMPLYFIMYFVFRNQMRERMKMIQ